MSSPSTIQCPSCSMQIDIDKIFYHQIEEKFKQKHKSKLEILKAKEEALDKEKEQAEEAVREAIREQIKQERIKIADELRYQITQEQGEAMAEMQQELEQKSKQIQELSTAKVEIERLKREKNELVFKVKMEAEQELNTRLSDEKVRMQKMLDEVATRRLKEIEETQILKLKEKDEQLKQLKRSLEDAKRKVEQGSMQVQGEVLELAIEDWLSSQFPFDTIEEVKKGGLGADCVQTVHTREIQNCGVLCYESKNTKAWSDNWINKLKQDMLKVNADIGVLVTSVYPNGMERMGWVDGIWVCSFDEFKGSVSLLRESLIRVHKTVQKEENRGDKMVLLYSYLTGNEFQMQLKAIVDGFMQMQTELDKERRSLMASWKRRQKLIDGVLQNTTEMYGSLQGIAGIGSLGHIEALELSEEMTVSTDK
ncbi:MAG: DUF2130 domain-containing protein [Sulfurovum sp.]|nr:DUF2130 domain-containing protein [Sulfurovum sp.]MCB4749069.1 DUF2130 domain-containing protein [Sulfurovum sp.]MCB4765164.1 DUF2130 domain-containing protein [Sulfurovum sp.]MCB4778401.1 DUF2130 domain-containing protein [Sulfurovum sp.]